jgi:selenocysteine-specific elongation factor
MQNIKRQYVVGTAGHIDHGKTALVQKLTGVDTDRLKEEKERGITIDLGFAHLTENVTIIDVPGHERLIKNMVAGVSTIDLVLFVIAADDGIMPQTREHLDIVNLLGIQTGIFVITKTDLVEEDWISLMEEEVKALLKTTHFKDPPIVRTSAITEQGVEDLKRTILKELEKVQARQDDQIFRLPVDRSFSKAGFGNIVTGSVISGKLKIGDTVEILPEKIIARIRGLHSHDKAVSEVHPGYRAAINLAGVEHDQLYRGQVITNPGFYEPVRLFDANVHILSDSPITLRNQMRLRLHLHTTEFFARIVLPERGELRAGESTFAQFKLEKPIYASFRDKFIIRQYSPPITIGGGQILETDTPKFRKKNTEEFNNRLSVLLTGSDRERILALFSASHVEAFSFENLLIKTGLDEKEFGKICQILQEQGLLYQTKLGKKNLFLSIQQIQYIIEEIKSVLTNYHKRYPGRSAMPLAELHSQLGKHRMDYLIQIAIEFGRKNGEFSIIEDRIALTDFQVKLPVAQQENIDKVEKLYLDAEFQPPLLNDIKNELGLNEKDLREFITILRNNHKLVPVEENIFFHRIYVDKAIQLIGEYFKKNDELKVSSFRELLETTRKYAIPLLSYLDENGYTERQEDVRLAGAKLR